MSAAVVSTSVIGSAATTIHCGAGSAPASERSSALNVRVDQIPKTQLARLRQAMWETIELRWFGSADRQSLLDLAARPQWPTNPRWQFCISTGSFWTVMQNSRDG